MSNKVKTGYVIQALIVMSILILINIIAQYYYGSIDMTEDRRYTISPPTVDLLNEVDEVVYVEVLLEGKFPAGIKRLQTAAKETLRSFNSESGGLIEYEFKDPLQGSDEDKYKLVSSLKERGVTPIMLKMPDDNKYVEEIIYPFAIFHFATKQVVVNLMEPDAPGVPREVILNNSTSLLEYKFASAIQKLLKTERGDIIITEGHGEASRAETTDLEVELRKFHNTARVNLDSVTQINPKIELVYMIRPTRPLSERAKFVIDQYIMKGGKMIFLLDRIDVKMNEITSLPQYVPEELDLNLDDLLFKYGARLKPNLLLDLECSAIPIRVGEQGDKPKIELRPWFYHPKIESRAEHPITNGLGRLSFKFTSTLDTIKTKTDVKKTVLLGSSDYSRTQTYPMRLGFELMKLRRDPDKFNKSGLPVALLLEGKFPSLYENRVKEGMHKGLRDIGQTFQNISPETKLAVIADGDLAINSFDLQTGEPRDFAYNSYDRLHYANKDFLLNLTEYMLDDDNILESRSKKIKLRMLDQEKALDKNKWRLINIGFPLALLFSFGVLYQIVRKRRYT